MMPLPAPDSAAPSPPAQARARWRRRSPACRVASWLAVAASLSCGGFASRAESAPPAAHVVVQLKWWHQYQFAGYYAAQLKGFYRDEGLDVELVEGSPARPPLQMVLDGQAEFAVSDTEVLLARMSGRPVVAIATIFQHSPYVLLTRRDSGISRPSDLAGRRVMLAGDRNEVQFFAMLMREGVARESISVVRHSWRLDDLLTGRVEAMSAYSTVEVAEMRSRGVEPGVIRASDYGVDFYGDTLFTSEATLARSPDRVAAFRRATIRGWEYALDHIDEIAAHIGTLPTRAPQRPSRERLVAEATEMRRLVLPGVVDVGHINPGRFERMAETFQEVGLHAGPYSLDGFVFDPEAHQRAQWHRTLAIGAAAMATAAIGALVWIGRLRRSVTRRTRQLAAEAAERQSAELELHASESRFRHIVEHMPALLDATDAQGRFVFWNRECERVTGYPAAEIVGNPEAMAWLYPDPALRGDVVTSRGATGTDNVEWTLRARDGQWRHILWRSLSSEVQIPGWAHWSIGIDLTAIRQMEDERARFEERLRRAQRLESLGLLAGGIAHDFNNLLTGMLGHAELASFDVGDRPQAVENLRLIERAARQAADLTRQLLAYSGRGRLVIEPLDVSRAIREMAQLLELTVSHRAQLSIEAAEGLPAVDADATQIRQVVMNLILNAAEAIGDGGGEIRVVTRTVTLDGQADVGNVAGGELGGGIYVSIDVHDTGCGMTDEVRARIFDPFYSTKFHGRGLGLAAVVGIVRSHRGGLLVRSDPGLGSCFSVMLPASARAAMPAEADSAPRQSFSWTGTALVVDDEPAVRDLAARMLGRLGFTVVVAIDGVDGLARLDEDGISPRVVVLDLTMPRMNGEETLRGLRGRGLMMPVIMASGYHESDITGRVEGLDPVLFLHKPFTFRQLHDALHRLLDAPSAGGGTAGAPRGQSTA